MQIRIVKGARDYLDRIRSLNRSVKFFLSSEMAYMFGRMVFRTIFNLYLLSMGYSMAYVGTFNAVRMLAQFAGSVPAGMVGKKIGLRNALIGGDGMIIAASAAQALAPGSAAIMGAAGMEGIAAALRTVNRPAFMAQRSNAKQRNHLFSIRSVLTNFMGMLGSGTGGFIPIMIAVNLGLDPGDPVAYRWTLILSLTVMTIGAALLFFIKKVQDATAGSNDNSARFADALKEKALRPLLSAEALLGFGGGLFLPILNAYLSEYLGASSGDVGLIFSVRRIVAAAAVLFSPVIAASLGKVKTVVSLQLLCVLPVLGIGFTSSLTLAGILVPLRRSFMSMSIPIQRAFTMEAFSDENRVAGYSVLRAGHNLTKGIAVAIGAWLMETIHPSTPFVVGALSYILCAMIIWTKFSAGNWSETFSGSQKKRCVADN